MLHQMINWIKGNKETPSPPKPLMDPSIEEAVLKSMLDRKRIEELLSTRQTGNLLADTWGARTNDN